MDFRRFWNLTFYLAKSGFKVRNEGSYLGILWYLLNPLLFFGLLWLIFSNNIGNSIESYPLYLFMGVIMFNFFQSATSESIGIIRDNRELFKSINFPRMAFISGSVLKFFFSHVFEFFIFTIFLVALKGNFANVLFYPLIILFFIPFVFGVSLILGSVSVYILDVEGIWTFASKLIWFATPIFYALNLSSKLSVINWINPLYYFITLARDLVVYNTVPSAEIIVGSALSGALFLAAGVLTFNKLKTRFTEII